MAYAPSLHTRSRETSISGSILSLGTGLPLSARAASRALIAIAAACAACTGSVDGGGDPGLGTDAGPEQPGPPGADAGFPAAYPKLHLSELMYHAVLDEGLEERYEFVELYNPNPEDVALDGWSLGGGVSYSFAAGDVIPAGGYLVIARDRAALVAVDGYALDSALVVGDYLGGLDNGGDTVLLLDPVDRIVEAVSYDDGAPWPIAADALGASERWLDPALLPLEQHRGRGRSLERVRFDENPAEVTAWDVSSSAGPTPGHASAERVASAAVIALAQGATAADDRIAARLIRAEDEVLIRVRLSRSDDGRAASELAEQVVVDYFVDDLGRTDEEFITVPLADDGASGDSAAGDDVYSALLPAQAEQSIVRYRVRLEDGAERYQVSPRVSDPQGWHAYFVSPVIDTETRTYQLYIDTGRWSEMFTNISGGRVQGCEPNPTWNEKVPAVFVFEGHVYDVFVRYQGSRYQRTNGKSMSWPGDAPAQPDPVRALSWRVQFPRYDRFEGKRVLSLNKLIQSCPGLTAGVGMQLFDDLDIPAARTNFARLHVNGYYYRYVLETERPGIDMFERYHRELAQRDLGSKPAGVGHLFKSTGCNCDEGPYGYGDGRLLGEHCGYAPEERYAATYDRKTHETYGHEPMIALIEDMHAARAEGIDAMRAYLDTYFDMDMVLDYMAVMNWSVPFDDMFHNHYFYQRLDDGKWLLVPWDLDRNFGDWRGARNLGPESSIYVGEEGDPDNRNNNANVFKDTILKAYRAEFEARIVSLNDSLLTPEYIAELVDNFIATADAAEADQALATKSCNFTGGADSFKRFAQERHDFIKQQLGTSAP
ncbi:MAG: hypothetical protein Tsb0020_01110 [Haliangiales bacterium]